MCYDNVPTAFITQKDDIGGSSLYYVTTHWVIRCSGNNTNGRVAETFIRRRKIVYISGNGTPSDNPQINTFPSEGSHNGNKIVCIFRYGFLNHPRGLWRSENGVSWQTAVDEIDAAIEYARITQYERASRVVGQRDFQRD